MNRITFFAFSVLMAAYTSLADPRGGDNTGTDASLRAPVPSPSERLNFQTDLFTGRFAYQVPLDLAPGRHGSTPTVGLHYNSSAQNGWCGVGWDLDLGYIQRETKHGVPIAWSGGIAQKAYDDTKGFVFSLNGRSADLVSIGGGEYRAEIEGGFLKFTAQTAQNQWIVTDPSGNKYYFGQTSASRMSNSKTGWSPSAWNGTYRWSLSHMGTPEGDTVDYTYVNNSGMLYPQQISYNGHSNGVTATHIVSFALQTRPDVTLSFRSGYRVEQNQRLFGVMHKVGSSTVWSNWLQYTTSPSTKRSLLKSVTRYGTNLTSTLPPISFGYSVQNFGFQPAVNWTNLSIPSGSPWSFPAEDYFCPAGSDFFSRIAFLDLLDVDGDGRPDRLYRPPTSPFTQFWMQRNTGHGFDNPVSFGLSVQTYSDGVVQNYTTQNNVDWTALSTKYTRMVDLNGDGLPDRVMDPAESLSGATGYAYTNLVAQLGGGTNFLTTNVRWTNVSFTNFQGAGIMDYRAVERSNIFMIDFNGDGLPDRVMSRQQSPFTNYLVQFNTGFGFTSSNVFSPLTYDDFGHDYNSVLESAWVRFIDMNGDGLPDRLMHLTNTATGGGEFICTNMTTDLIEFNNGYGFEPPVVWGTNDNWYLRPSCSANYECTEGNIQDYEERAIRDVNGDGLPDRVYRQRTCSYTNMMVQLNLGTNFSAPMLYGTYTSGGQYANLQYEFDYTALSGKFARFLDIDGDGIPDRVVRAPNDPNAKYYIVELSKGPIPDLMTSITNGIGGFTSVTYKLSDQYDNRDSTTAANPKNLLPFPQQTVSSVSVSDGIYPANTTTYAYEGGMWASDRREFHGFARVVVRDSLGLTNVYWHHQSGGRDNSTLGEYQDTPANIGKNGMSFRVETYGTNGQLYKVVLNKIEDVNLGSGRHFAFITNTFTLNYPGNGTTTPRVEAKAFKYDLTTGNLTNTIAFGEINPSITLPAYTWTDITGDEVYHFTTFTNFWSGDIVDRPQRTILTSDAPGSTILRETLYDYNSTTATLAKKRDRICSGSYVTNTFGYDTYNNLTTSTNEAGVYTITTYETTYRTYPSQQTIGNTLTTTFSYDARSGNLQSSTDPKGLVTANAYDPFLRLLETDISTTPNGSPTLWLIRNDYSLGTLANGFPTNFVHTRKNDSVDTVSGYETWTYSDGLGRPIQLRHEAETAGYRVTDSIYDKRGAVQFETQSYFSSGAALTRPATTLLGILREYDPIGRLAKVTPGVNGAFSNGQLTTTSVTGGDTGSPLGSIGLAYNDGNNPWVLVRTDDNSPNNNQVHKYFLDAFDRTNQIVEINGASTYTSTLNYDKAGVLTNITDDAANKIDYALNDLGQVVAMSDPDMGRWDYFRDFAGRLRRQVDSKTNAVTFDYSDPLGRLKARIVTNALNLFVYGVTNYYDSNGGETAYTVYPGQLFKTMDAEGWTKFSHDFRGRLLKSVRFLVKTGQSYTNQFSYDDMDRVTQTIYPNGGPTVANDFDTGGNLLRVRRIGGDSKIYYSASGFNALGQITSFSIGDNKTTSYSYFPNSARLSSIACSGLQSLNYTYDKVSNLKSISDALNTSGAASASISSIAYDDLNRVTSFTRPGVSQNHAFAYSSIGNLLTNSETGGGTYLYTNRMPHAVKQANGKNYAYDANGNMIVRDNQRLDYDPENRLTVVGSASSVVTFGYDGSGARLWKQTVNNSSTNLQIWIGGNYEEKLGSVLYHISAGSRLVCTFDRAGTVLDYYHPDHLQSSTVLSDGSGGLVQHYEYSAFGNQRYQFKTTPFPVSKRYTGQVLDEETGLYFYGARYYAPELGRFIQADGLITDLSNPQNFNRYTYVLNNPFKHVDPTGHSEDNVVETALAPKSLKVEVQRPTQQIYTQIVFKDGTQTEFGSHGFIYDPNKVAGYRYSLVTTFANGRQSWMPITKDMVAEQQRIEFLKMLPSALMWADGAGGLAKGIGTKLAAEGAAGAFMDAGRGGFIDLALAQKHSGLINLLRQGDVVMPSGSMTASLMGDLTSATGREVALLRVDGVRVLRLGGPQEFRGFDASRVIAHTHPSGILELSGGDIQSFQMFQPAQRSTVLVGPSGAATRVPIPRQ